MADHFIQLVESRHPLVVPRDEVWQLLGDLLGLVLADWLDEHGWDAEAAYYRSRFAAAAWRLELAVREVLKLGIIERSVIEAVFTDGVNKAATMIRQAVAQHLAERQSDHSEPRASRKRTRTKPRKK